jgi:hypothetical protein
LGVISSNLSSNSLILSLLVSNRLIAFFSFIDCISHFQKF